MSTVALTPLPARRRLVRLVSCHRNVALRWPSWTIDRSLQGTVQG